MTTERSPRDRRTRRGNGFDRAGVNVAAMAYIIEAMGDEREGERRQGERRVRVWQSDQKKIAGDDLRRSDRRARSAMSPAEARHPEAALVAVGEAAGSTEAVGGEARASKCPVRIDAGDCPMCLRPASEHEPVIRFWENDDVTDENRPAKVRCSFCGKSKDSGVRMVGGPGNVAICDECVGGARELLWPGEDHRSTEEIGRVLTVTTDSLREVDARIVIVREALESEDPRALLRRLAPPLEQQNEPAAPTPPREPAPAAGTLVSPYKRGFMDGVRAYAHWREGRQEVGTTGTLLSHALRNVEDTWNYAHEEDR